jgi:PleD family two-component response regulator
VLKQAHSQSDLGEQLSAKIIIRKFEDGVAYLVVRSAPKGRACGQITLTSGTAPTGHTAMMAARRIADRTQTSLAEFPKIVGLTYTEHSGGIRKERCERACAFHILIVEHESSYLDVLQKMLERDYQVSFTRTVAEAQAIVQTSRIDVALVGSALPDGQGADFAALAERLGAAVIEMR